MISQPVMRVARHLCLALPVMGVKFTDLLTLARDLGCDAMATGHYVRRVEGAAGPELHRPVDETRDQSWFLFATTRDQLNYLRFPLGAYASKAEVRQKAESFGLKIADRRIVRIFVLSRMAPTQNGGSTEAGGQRPR